MKISKPVGKEAFAFHWIFFILVQLKFYNPFSTSNTFDHSMLIPFHTYTLGSPPSHAIIVEMKVYRDSRLEM